MPLMTLGIVNPWFEEREAARPYTHAQAQTWHCCVCVVDTQIAAVSLDTCPPGYLVFGSAVNGS